MKTHTEDLAVAQNKRPAEHEATVERNKPETALPWYVEGASERWTAGITADCDGTAVVWVCHLPTRDREQGIQFEGDAHYIVHACNAYPKLVAALRDMIEADYRVDPERLVHVETDLAESLLRKLGEL